MSPAVIPRMTRRRDAPFRFNGWKVAREGNHSLHPHIPTYLHLGCLVQQVRALRKDALQVLQRSAALRVRCSALEQRPGQQRRPGTVAAHALLLRASATARYALDLLCVLTARLPRYSVTAEHDCCIACLLGEVTQGGVVQSTDLRLHIIWIIETLT